MVASRPEHDYAALVFAGAEAVQLELTLERADREVTEREADSAALVIAQMRELVAAVAGRLPHPSVQHGSTKRPPYGNNLQTAARTKVATGAYIRLAREPVVGVVFHPTGGSGQSTATILVTTSGLCAVGGRQHRRNLRFVPALAT